jgi:hypothetical protein
LRARDSSELVVRVGFLGVDTDRFAEALDGGLVLAALDVDQAKLIVRVGVSRIERQSEVRGICTANRTAIAAAKAKTKRPSSRIRLKVFNGFR